jgi:hypothetical protein
MDNDFLKKVIVGTSDDTNTTKNPFIKAVFANKDRFIKWIMMSFGVIAVIIAVYFISHIERLPDTGTLEVTGDELIDVVNAVSQIMVLPDGEMPTIVTVTNPEDLAGQNFFTKVEKGYKILIYSTAKKAILYDPEMKKIVNVSTVKEVNYE